MAQTRDWKGMWEMSARLLQERTGEDLATWNQRIQAQGFQDEQALRLWLISQEVTGYAQTLLVMISKGRWNRLSSSSCHCSTRLPGQTIRQR